MRAQWFVSQARDHRQGCSSQNLTWARELASAHLAPYDFWIEIQHNATVGHMFGLDRPSRTQIHAVLEYCKGSAYGILEFLICEAISSEDVELSSDQKHQFVQLWTAVALLAGARTRSRRTRALCSAAIKEVHKKDDNAFDQIGKMALVFEKLSTSQAHPYALEAVRSAFGQDAFLLERQDVAGRLGIEAATCVRFAHFAATHIP
jgi:hypothetical protein